MRSRIRCRERRRITRGPNWDSQLQRTGPKHNYKVSQLPRTVDSERTGVGEK